GMVEREFDALWDFQRKHHANLLTDEARERIHDAIFDQRPLKPVDPGRCRYEADERRAPLALQSTQLFRIYQEVNGLRVKDSGDVTLSTRPLTRDERDAAVDYLRVRAKCTLSALKKHVVGKNPALSFTLEAGERANMLGDIVTYELSKPQALGETWQELSLDAQDAIALEIHDATSDEALVEALVSS